ncbi:MAG: winged helix-turn-helix domain-containing protein [Vicinamibacterales bacterium]
MSRVRFDVFELDLAGGELRRGDTPIHLQPQPSKVLMLLASRAGELVSREEIQKQVWAGDTFVDFDQGLNYCIRQIRAALGDAAETPRFIETVPRRGYRFLAGVTPAAAPAPGRAMLVVLPFQNLTGDPDEDYLSDGLTEEVIAQLARLNPEGLGVIARTSAMRYKRTDKSIEMIGRELAVSHALEGSLRRGDGRIRVTTQLIRIGDRTHLWAESFDRGAGDILGLQADVAQAVAREIGIQLTPQARVQLASPRVVDPRVYEAYLKGRYFWKKRAREALLKSVQYFNQAIEIDSSYAPAYAGLADVYLTQLDYNYLPPREAFMLAERALFEGLRLDDMVAEPHTSLGHLRMHQFKWAAAEQQFRRAIALNAGYDSAHYYYGNLLAAYGRFDAAIAEANRALELDPLAVNARLNRLFILYMARRYDRALEEISEALELDPAHTPLYYHLGLVYERQGAYDRAIEAFQKVSLPSHSRGATVLAAIGYAHAKAGRRAEAAAILKQLEDLCAREYVSLYDLALLHLALNDSERAFERLSKAYDDYSSFLPFLNVDARFDEVRGDPRFRSLVERLNFPGEGL